MSLGITNLQYYSDMADAIRSKNGLSDLYKPSEMASAIENIPSGGGGVPSEYLNLIQEAVVQFEKRTYNNEGWYFQNLPKLHFSSAITPTSVVPIFPNGNESCSAEVYYNAQNDIGYLLGFGNTSSKAMFSFTPGKFVGYDEDHPFQTSYPGKHHLVLTLNGTTLKLYVDGALTETITLGSNLYIGNTYCFQGRWANTNTELFTGDIYHTRIWRRELTAQEVTVLYNNK